jgi:hypothetical protein
MRVTVNEMATHRVLRVFWWIFGIWTACAVLLLAVGVWTYSNAMSGENPTSLGEQRMSVYFLMMMLGFPLGFFVPGWLSDILNPHGYELFSVSHTAAILFVRDWVILLVLGWLQWFGIVPMLLRLILPRRRDGHDNTAGRSVR